MSALIEALLIVGGGVGIGLTFIFLLAAIGYAKRHTRARI